MVGVLSSTCCGSGQHTSFCTEPQVPHILLPNHLEQLLSLLFPLLCPLCPTLSLSFTDKEATYLLQNIQYEQLSLKEHRNSPPDHTSVSLIQQGNHTQLDALETLLSFLQKLLMARTVIKYRKETKTISLDQIGKKDANDLYHCLTWKSNW